MKIGAAILDFAGTIHAIDIRCIRNARTILCRIAVGRCADLLAVGITSGFAGIQMKILLAFGDGTFPALTGNSRGISNGIAVLNRAAVGWGTLVILIRYACFLVRTQMKIRLAVHNGAGRIHTLDLRRIRNFSAVVEGVIDGHRIRTACLRRIWSTFGNLGVFKYRMRVFGTIRDDTCTILTKCIRILQLAILAFNAALVVVVDAG